MKRRPLSSQSKSVAVTTTGSKQSASWRRPLKGLVSWRKRDKKHPTKVDDPAVWSSPAVNVNTRKGTNAVPSSYHQETDYHSTSQPSTTTATTTASTSIMLQPSTKTTDNELKATFDLDRTMSTNEDSHPSAEVVQSFSTSNNLPTLDEGAEVILVENTGNKSRQHQHSTFLPRDSEEISKGVFVSFPAPEIKSTGVQNDNTLKSPLSSSPTSQAMTTISPQPPNATKPTQTANKNRNPLKESIQDCGPLFSTESGNQSSFWSSLFATTHPSSATAVASKSSRPVEEISFPTPSCTVPSCQASSSNDLNDMRGGVLLDSSRDDSLLNVSELDDIHPQGHNNISFDSIPNTRWPHAFPDTSKEEQDKILSERVQKALSLRDNNNSDPPSPPPLPNVFSQDQSSIGLNPHNTSQESSPINISSFLFPKQAAVLEPVGPPSHANSFKAIPDADFLADDDLSAITPKDSVKSEDSPSKTESPPQEGVEGPTDSWDSEIMQVTNTTGSDGPSSPPPPRVVHELTSTGEIIQSTIDASRLRKAIGQKVSRKPTRPEALERRMKKFGVKRSPKRPIGRKLQQQSPLPSTPEHRAVVPLPSTPRRPHPPLPEEINSLVASTPPKKSVNSSNASSSLPDAHLESITKLALKECDSSASSSTMEITLQMNTQMSVNSELTNPPSLEHGGGVMSDFISSFGGEILQSYTFEGTGSNAAKNLDDDVDENSNNNRFNCARAWDGFESLFSSVRPESSEQGGARAEPSTGPPLDATTTTSITKSIMTGRFDASGSQTAKNPMEDENEAT